MGKYLNWNDDINKILNLQRHSFDTEINCEFLSSHELGYIKKLYPKFCNQFGIKVSEIKCSVLTNSSDEYIRIHIPSLKETIYTDLENVKRNIGLNNFLSPELFNISSIPYSFETQKYIAYQLAIQTVKKLGMAPKCIFLDGDNTLWGEIIDEVGVDKVVYSREFGNGLSFHNFQTYLKTLSDKGVLLVLTTKNELIDIQNVFKIKNMALALKDFAVIKANWRDKSHNVLDTLKELNIAPEASLFLDDSIYERENIRLQFPQILTPDLPQSPHFYCNYLAGLNLFNVDDVTYEDNTRIKSVHLKLKHVDLNKEIETKVTISKLKESDKSRFIQLANKTNQFNLNGLKQTEVDFNLFLSPPYTAYSAKLSDSNLNYGLIGFIVGKECSKSSVKIEHFFISCRAFDRKVEYKLIKEFKSYQSIEFNLNETGKNHLVKHFINSLEVLYE